MRKFALSLLTLAVGIGIGLTIAGRQARVEAARSKQGTGFAAVPGTLGSEDLTGPYEVAKNWPQDALLHSTPRRKDASSGGIAALSNR